MVASYMIPPYEGAIAWTQLLNPDVGYLNQLLKTLFSLSQAPFNIYTRGGMIWVLTLFYSPFAFITISRAMEKMDPTLEEASRIAGASPLKALWDVTLPLMAPSILAGGLLVFIGAYSCFGIPAIVGMPGNIEVLTTRIVSFVYMGDDKGIRDATTPGRFPDVPGQRAPVLHELDAGPEGLYHHQRQEHPAGTGGTG